MTAIGDVASPERLPTLASTTVRSNGVDASLEYDSSGRVDRVLYEHSATTLDDLVLTYNGLGLISRIDRLYDGASPVLGVRRDYEYDAAYRLAKESYTEIESGSPDTYTLKSYRAYAYDAAGNRSTMTRWNTTNSKVTTYTYGDREELDSSTEYEHDGSSLTGDVTYTYDVRGNTEYRRFATDNIEWDYGWNENDRLVSVEKLDYDGSWANPSLVYTVSYGYDAAGRRIWKNETDGTYTRSWFNGLTEEVRKTSVGSDDPADFVKHLKEDGNSVSEWYLAPTVIDESGGARRSSVLRQQNGDFYHSSAWPMIGDNDANTINGNDAPWASTDRVASLWYRGAGTLKFYVETSSGEKTLTYYMWNGTSGVSSGNVNIFLGTGAQTSTWTRFERNLEQDYEQYSGGISWQEVNGLRIMATASPLTSGPPFDETHTFYLDDISLSDAQTVEHNVLGPGSIGHILRHRTINPTTYAATDKWFGYDQVGSVLHETDDSGALASRHHQDAWGNVMQSYATGLWDSGVENWLRGGGRVDLDNGLGFSEGDVYDPQLGAMSGVSDSGDRFVGRCTVLGTWVVCNMLIAAVDGLFLGCFLGNPGGSEAEWRLCVATLSPGEANTMWFLFMSCASCALNRANKYLNDLPCKKVARLSCADPSIGVIPNCYEFVMAMCLAGKPRKPPVPVTGGSGVPY